MKRNINKVAILGSGIMGSRIACHFANIGVDALLLDIIPKDLSEEEKAKGLTLESPQVRNRIVNSSLQSTLKANPSPIYKKSFSSRIRTGNFSDDMKNIAFTTNEEMIKHPEIISRIAEEIKTQNESLGNTEQVKKFELLPKEWTLETGELTATQKLKRKIIMANYKELISKIYSES